MDDYKGHQFQNWQSSFLKCISKHSITKINKIYFQMGYIIETRNVNFKLIKTCDNQFFLKSCSFLKIHKNVSSIVSKMLKFHKKLQEIFQQIRKKCQVKICKHNVFTESMLTWVLNFRSVGLFNAGVHVKRTFY